MAGRIQAALHAGAAGHGSGRQEDPGEDRIARPSLRRRHHGPERFAYQNFQQLAGKRIAIPSRFAVDFLFLRKMLARENMTPADIQIIEMAPPDMPAALYANAVDAYCTGEPFGAAAQHAGYARPLRMTRDEWRNYICCVLTVREELIQENPALVQDLVNQVLGAGVWLDAAARRTATRRSPIAAGRDFFNQDPKIIQFVMENPTDRVTYGDLRMIRAEFEELMQLSMQAGTIKHPIRLRDAMWTRALPETRMPPPSRCERPSTHEPVGCAAAVGCLIARAASRAEAGAAQGRRFRSGARRRRISRCADPTAPS